MKTSLIVVISLLFFCAVRAEDKTTTDSHGIIRRSGEPDCFQVADNNKEMAQAVQKARKALPQFFDAVRSLKSNQSRFAVKKPFIEGEKVEHLWVNDLSFDGRVFRGKVDNEPLDLKGVHLGDEVTVSPEEISDWMFVQDGKLVGGYTVRCCYRHLSSAEKKQFEKDAGCRVD